MPTDSLPLQVLRYLTRWSIVSDVGTKANEPSVKSSIRDKVSGFDGRDMMRSRNNVTRA